MIFKKNKKEKSNEDYRDLAIQAGEEYGALIAEWFMLSPDSPEAEILEERQQTAYHNMLSNAKRVRYSNSFNK